MAHILGKAGATIALFQKTKEVFTIKEQVITVWSPAGLNTAKVSWPLANHIARHTTIALVELPCMGIPRLALQADCLDRTLHTDAAILEYERKTVHQLTFAKRLAITWPYWRQTLTLCPITQWCIKLKTVKHCNPSPLTLSIEQGKRLQRYYF